MGEQNINIQDLFELTTRVDERIQNINKRQQNLDEVTNNINSKLHEIELKIQNIETQLNNHKVSWDRIISFCVQVTLIIFSAYMAYTLGLQLP